jgi:hypothetical protein
LEGQSNQLAAVYTELKNLKPATAAKFTPSTTTVEREYMNRARQQDISQQLFRK